MVSVPHVVLVGSMVCGICPSCDFSRVNGVWYLSQAVLVLAECVSWQYEFLVHPG